MKLCTKCGKELNDQVIFCSDCGTKQYITEMNKEHQGMLLVQIPKCRLIVMKLLPVECELFLWDNRIAAIGSNEKKHMELSLTAVSEVNINKQTLLIKSMKEKLYQITFPSEQADFIFYVKELILDYRQHCIDTRTYVETGESAYNPDKLAGMGVSFWVKEKPVEEQNITKGRVKAEKLYTAKTGRTFRFCGSVYQNIQQLGVKIENWSYTDIYGRIGTYKDQRFPIFDSYDALTENRYWRYFYMYDKGILNLIVFADEKTNTGSWKSDKVNMDMEIFENVT